MIFEVKIKKNTTFRDVNYKKGESYIVGKKAYRVLNAWKALDNKKESKEININK